MACFYLFSLQNKKEYRMLMWSRSQVKVNDCYKKIVNFNKGDNCISMGGSEEFKEEEWMS